MLVKEEEKVFEDLNEQKLRVGKKPFWNGREWKFP